MVVSVCSWLDDGKVGYFICVMVSRDIIVILMVIIIVVVSWLRVISIFWV